MGQYKLIALDLDGSLLHSNLEISSVNRLWITKAKQAGLVVSFATGRGRGSSEQYWDAVSSKAPMVVINGSEVWGDHLNLLSRHFLASDCVPELYDLVQKYGTWYWGHTAECFISKENWWTEHLQDLVWSKFGFAHQDLSIIEELRTILLDWPELEVTSSAPTNLEISRRGINKASGLLEITELLSISPQEIVAIGDNLNDLEMIKLAGFGVAMGNATQEVKDAADYITTTNDDDGVAQVIQLILE